MPATGRSSWKRSIVGLASASLLVVTLVTTAQARPVLIRGLDQRWSPAGVSVARGTVVKWRGVSKFHDVLAYGGNWTYSKSLPVGAVVKKRFRAAGTFRFRCTFHSTLIGTSCTGMCGSVRVTT